MSKLKWKKEIQIEVSLAEDTKEEVVLAALPKLCFLSDFPSAKVLPDQNDFRLENSIS